jgi:hypothetical protein
MSKWIAILDEKLAEASYHFTTKDFQLPYQFLVNDEFVL